MRISKEEFCKRHRLTEEQFYGKNLCVHFVDSHIEYIPEGCFLNTRCSIYLESLKELPEGCRLRATHIELSSLKKLPENYFIEAKKVTCNIIIPTYKGSSEFYFSEWTKKKSFKDFDYIREEPLKHLGSDKPLERALAEYFLKESL